ncbi:MAG: hypothetical protein JNL63_12850 [Bacteroidia bacterium]|nr:hypothetical protein [Bacteroidia bacterium]
MFSLKTNVELIYVIEQFSHSEIDRMLNIFGWGILLYPPDLNMTKVKKTNYILNYLKTPQKGPYTESLQMDILQYLIDNFYRNKPDPKNLNYAVYQNPNETKYEDLFSFNHNALTYSLKRDGFVIKGREVRKILPNEIVEARTEDELVQLLNKFKFTITKGHLEQAINNHAQGNWAGANSQFRPFIESLLIDICKKILPQNNCESGATAIKLLSLTANPTFLKSELNEIENSKCDKPFVEGLWKRLHPEGTHPGLSDEEDSTFRYHISIVFAHYLLKRLDKRL